MSPAASSTTTSTTTGIAQTVFPHDVEGIKTAFEDAGLKCCYHTIKDPVRRINDYKRITRIRGVQPWELMAAEFRPLNFGYFHLRILSEMAGLLQNRTDRLTFVKQIIADKLSLRGTRSGPLQQIELRVVVEGLKQSRVQFC
ncbi:hypothetical protein EJ08DRAFT_733506 [Tothia fuscella]|uniref:Uncharacterized protein n=1 Tax=Tothia fuscella TaxID=1048955 RepID=A0A9P4NU15_9PEZI|nr:hypothetical protein EJ08DRAFT_733506 [Tothia fuscella]